MAQQRQYDHEYKVQAVKLAQEIGGAHTPQSAMTLNEELIQLRKQLKDQDKEIKRLKKENEFLEEASAFSQRTV